MDLRNFISGIFTRASKIVLGHPSQSSAELTALLSAGLETSSGVNVDSTSAMRVNVVFACVRVISETIASLPLVLYKRSEDGKGKDRATAHPYYDLLDKKPNDEMTAFEMRENLQHHLCLRGNAYSYVEWTGAGVVDYIYPLDPDRMGVKRTAAGALSYEYTYLDGSKEIFTPEHILHLRGLSSNGIIGYNPIEQARESLGISITAEKRGAASYAKGVSISGYLGVDGVLQDDVRTRLKDEWDKKYSGYANAGKTPVLEQGLKFTPLTMTAEDAQFIELRKYTAIDICRIFRVPPHMIADLERATFSNIEQQAIGFVRDCVYPWCRRWEQRLNISILTDKERADGYFFEHLIDGLLRGDIASRFAAYSTAVNTGFMTQNEVRALENLNPKDGGDVLRAPLNTAEVGKQPPAPEQKELEGDNGVNGKNRIKELITT